MAERILSRRNLLRFFGIATGGTVVKPCLWPYMATAQDPPRANTVEPSTGPEPNSRCNSVGPYFTEPQKAPLLLLTDRPVQLETLRHYFLTPFTPNEAFYVRWHLEGIPNAVDLKEWKLRIEGDVRKPIALSMSDLIQKFKPISIAAVNQCSGNSRSRDGLSKIPAGMGVTLRGIAFSGFGGVVCAEVSDDGGKTWAAATLGEDHGPYSFRAWEMPWTPKSPGRYSLAVRATDQKNNTQPDEPVWNPGGYLWNRIERQEMVVGNAS